MKNKNLHLFIHPACIYGNQTGCRALSEVQQAIKNQDDKACPQGACKKLSEKSGKNAG